MRKALVIGVDYYTHVNSLNGCVNDAYAVKQVLERHGDGTKNFDVEIITATDATSAITKDRLIKEVKELFENLNETEKKMVYLHVFEGYSLKELACQFKIKYTYACLIYVWYIQNCRQRIANQNHVRQGKSCKETD